MQMNHSITGHQHDSLFHLFFYVPILLNDDAISYSIHHVNHTWIAIVGSLSEFSLIKNIKGLNRIHCLLIYFSKPCICI